MADLIYWNPDNGSGLKKDTDEDLPESRPEAEKPKETNRLPKNTISSFFWRRLTFSAFQRQRRSVRPSSSRQRRRIDRHRRNELNSQKNQRGHWKSGASSRKQQMQKQPIDFV